MKIHAFMHTYMGIHTYVHIYISDFGISLSSHKHTYTSKPPSTQFPLTHIHTYTHTYIHTHIHTHTNQDLKPPNFLIDEFDHCVVADFGISKVVSGTLGAHMPSNLQVGYIHTYTHTHTHAVEPAGGMHTYIHTHTCRRTCRWDT